MIHHNYFVYITTNVSRTVLYIGVTNDLEIRRKQHHDNKGKQETFAGRYYCHNLVYWERFQYINDAIAREKELKKWNRSKKNNLIEDLNPSWKFLNQEVLKRNTSFQVIFPFVISGGAVRS